jgi:hypothetical protein
MAATVQNGSYASPLANSQFAAISGGTFVDSILSQVGSLNGWQIALTLFVMAVAYDQCKSRTFCAPVFDRSSCLNSQLYQAKGHNCRSNFQDSFHWSVSRIHGSKVQRVQGEMG